MDVGKELSSVIPGIPPCPINCGGTGSAALTAARNSLQDWLCTLLRFPGVRESPSIRLFLCNEANVLPVRFQGIIDWFGFECDSSGSANSSRAVSGNGRNQSLDEMEMDDMFDTGGGFDGADEEDEEDDEAVAYAVRYPPAQEELTTEDRMEFHEEVEMVEDVGSLAQSLGASHLGRSLQLQAEIAHVKQQKDSRTTKVVPSGEQQGVTVGGASGEKANGSSGGGIGGIVEGAQFGQQPPSNPLAKISGLGNSFRQHTPVSPPRLDSFTLIKVIGKGSFGEELPTSAMLL